MQRARPQCVDELTAWSNRLAMVALHSVETTEKTKQRSNSRLPSASDTVTAVTKRLLFAQRGEASRAQVFKRGVWGGAKPWQPT